MSYILEALKKSESERGRGDVPNVQTVHSSSLLYNTQQRPIWPYLLLIGVFFNFIAISYFIYTQQDSSTPPEVSAASYTNEPLEVSPTSTIAQMPVVTTNDHQPEQTPITQTVVAPLPVTKSEKPGDTAITSHQRPEQKTDTTPNDITNVPVDHPTVAKQYVAASKANDPVTAQPESAAESPVSLTPLPEIPITEQYSDVIDQSELPESVKRTLPTITISAHVFSSTPSQRSMVINDQFLEEGDHVIDGLILDEITPGGAIFRYQDYRFSNDTVSGWR